MAEEDFSFDLLSRKQLIKLITSYDLPIDKSLSRKQLLKEIKEHLKVTDDGYILNKLEGSGTGDIEFYLQDRNGTNHKLSVDEFVKAIKPNNEASAREALKDFYDDALHNIKEDNEIETVMLQETSKQEKGFASRFRIIMDFLTLHADKLSDVLCQKQLNVKYVRAYSHYELNDCIFLNMLHQGKKVIIKGFAFCSNPSKEELYVSTVCGTGGTAKIFQHMVNIMMENQYKEPLSYIHLDSVESPNTISFYSKLGFRKTDKDTMAIIKDMYKSKAKTFDEYVTEGKSVVGGAMYLFAPDSRGERQLKKKKCHFVYTPKEWFDEIKKGKKQTDLIKSLRTEKLEGAGLGSFFRSIYNKVADPILSSLSPAYAIGKKIVNNIDTIKKYVNPHLERYTNRTKEILNTYGNQTVSKLTIVRSPVKPVVDAFVNLITMGKFDELKKQYSFDKMFHLGVIASVRKDGKLTHILIEKNERIELSINKQFPPDAEFQENPMGPKQNQITINQMLNNAQGCMGTEKFFDYDAFENNCQVFIVKVLECSGMLDDINKKFILQDVSEMAKQLPEGNKNLMRAFTTLGAVVSRLRGAGRMEGGYGVPGIHLEPEQWDAVLAPYDNDERVLGAREQLKSEGFTQNTETINALVRQHPKARGLGWGVKQQPGENKWFKYTPGTNYYEWQFDPAMDFFLEDYPQYSAVSSHGKTITAGEAQQAMEEESRKRRTENPTSQFMDVFLPIASKIIPSKVVKAGELITGYDSNLSPQENFEKGLQQHSQSQMEKFRQSNKWKSNPSKQDFNAYLPTKRWHSGGEALLNQDGSVYLRKQGRTNFTSGYYPDVDLFYNKDGKKAYHLSNGKKVNLETLEPKAFLSEAESMKKQDEGQYLGKGKKSNLKKKSKLN